MSEQTASYHSAMKPHRIYVVANVTKAGAEPAIDEVAAWCRDRSVGMVRIADRLPEKIGDGMVVALGGDGTVLRAANLFVGTGLPVLGINLGSLGFLTQVAAEALTDSLCSVSEGNYRVEERMRLLYRIGDLTGSVLNDLVFTGTTASRFCELELSWRDGIVSSFPGDGLILATATGSTAYSLSAGGPVIVPPAACILATPLAVHKLGLRPVIFPADEVLEVRAATALDLIADGDEIARIDPGTRIRIQRADEVTKLVHIADARPFFHVLDEKLNWGDHRRRL